MAITKAEESALVGMVLGDGYLQPTGKRNARLRLEHSIKQEDYLEWKVSLLSPQFQGKIIHTERVHPKTKQKYSYVRAQSNASPFLGKLRLLFYPEGTKKIPDNLSRYLRHPLGLAIWYMDDGYYSRRKHDKSVYLYLGTVTMKDSSNAQKAIEKRFNLKTTIVDKKKKGFVLYFSPVETKKLFACIQEIVEKVEKMKYKIPF